MVTAKKRPRPAARRLPARAAPPPVDLRATFAALKNLLVKHARHLLIVHDAQDEYYLNTRKLGPNGKPVFFGAVMLKRNFVSYHLFSLYVDPALVTALSPALRQHMQGKSCFNFVESDPALFEELDRLTRTAMASFERKGLA
jgi:hypothetical protein